VDSGVSLVAFAQMMTVCHMTNLPRAEYDITNSCGNALLRSRRSCFQWKSDGCNVSKCLNDSFKLPRKYKANTYL